LLGGSGVQQSVRSASCEGELPTNSSPQSWHRHDQLTSADAAGDRTVHLRLQTTSIRVVRLFHCCSITTIVCAAKRPRSKRLL
jgi:hypothetical protein